MMSVLESGKSPSELQLAKLANLLLLESRLRDAATEIELGYTVVNDTLSLVSGSTGLLWRNPASGNFKDGEIVAVSASALPAKNTPFAKWAANFCLALDEHYQQQTSIVDPANLAVELRETTHHPVAAQSVWLPIVFRGEYLGALLLFREQPWTDPELRILQQWIDTIAHAWHALRFTRRGLIDRVRSNNKPRILGVAALLIVASLLLPVRLSVLAPAELKSGNSTIVRSPIQGVIDTLHIDSNEAVSSGQLLVSLDDTALTTQLEVARQELEIARAEYRQSNQAAAFSEEAKANLQVQRITLEKYIAEVNYLVELLSRTDIRAEVDATAIVENPDEFVGRPVQLGERLLTLVDSRELELEMWLPVGDDIELVLGNEINFFPNVAPDRVYEGSLITMDYEAQLSPLGTLAYRARATITIPQESVSRIGMRGTSKLYGNRVSLFYYLFRRPISFIRQSVGV